MGNTVLPLSLPLPIPFPSICFFYLSLLSDKTKDFVTSFVEKQSSSVKTCHLVKIARLENGLSCRQLESRIYVLPDEWKLVLLLAAKLD